MSFLFLWGQACRRVASYILQKLSPPLPPLLSVDNDVKHYLVFGVEDHRLGVRDPYNVVLEGGGRQPNASRQFVVEQRQLRDQPLGLLLFSGQHGKALPNAHQRLDELSLRSETHRLTDGEKDGETRQ